jgi:hypothetical protein
MTNQFPDATKMVLSPAAQAVLDAFICCPIEINDQLALAAALRAAADQLGYSNVPKEFAYMRPKVIDVDDLLAIAAELEAHG